MSGGKDGTGSLTSPFHSTTIVCRTVRIGSFKFVPKENVIISSTAIKIVAPAIMNPSETISLYIPLQYILRVLVNYNKSLPILFFYVTPSIAGIVRKKLGMVDGSDLYFDPTSKQEPFKRITVIPEIISDENKSIMKEIFTINPYKILDELTPKEANNILIRTCPKDVTAPKVAPSTNNSFSEVRQLLIYPPGKGGIAINAEDYLCLAQDQFLNDVIIDFYLKYVMTEVIAADMQNKVHIFSSFFYKRLTTKPAKATKKLNPFEVDPTLTAAQKRHLRVKNWTKNVNIFEKDFIIIPINENSHWFLAIICFPSLEGCRSMEDANKIIKLPPKVKKIKEKPQCSITIGNTTITVRTDTTAIPMEKPIKCEDEELSDRDEADGDDSELEESETEEDEDSLPKKPKTREPIKQPCILIFDSLTGASRSRVVATLRDYLTCEHRVKLNSTKSFTKDNIKGACPKVPQQMNFTDCGLYVLQYVEAFFKNPITDYHIPIKQLKNWFEELTVTRKREDISILIKNLMTENNRDSSNVPEITFPTLNGKLTTAAEEHPPSEEEEEETEQGLEPGEIPSKELSKSLVSDVYNSESSDESPKQDEAASTQTSSSAVVVSTMASSIVVTELNSALKPDLSDVSKKSNRETMSYLKSKRILRHKNNDISEVKKQKID